MGNVNVGTFERCYGKHLCQRRRQPDRRLTRSPGTSFMERVTVIRAATIVSGTVTQAANSVPTVNLPSAVSFTPGTNDITTASNLTLAPGSYGNVTESGQFQNIYLVVRRLLSQVAQRSIRGLSLSQHHECADPGVRSRQHQLRQLTDNLLERPVFRHFQPRKFRAFPNRREFQSCRSQHLQLLWNRFHSERFRFLK